MCWLSGGSSLSVYEKPTKQFFICGIGSPTINGPLCKFRSSTAGLSSPCSRCHPGITGPVYPQGYFKNYGQRDEKMAGRQGSLFQMRRHYFKAFLRPSDKNQNILEHNGPTGIFSNVCSVIPWINQFGVDNPRTQN